MAYTMDDATESMFRELLKKAKPYAENEQHEMYFDCISDRDEATMAVKILKRAGRWTDEDEKKYMT